MLRHILFQFIERHLSIFEGCPNNLMFLVPYTKHNPAKFMFSLVGFVAERREVLSQLIHIKVGFSLFEFYHFIFGMFPKAVEYFYTLIHTLNLLSYTPIVYFLLQT